MNLAPEKNGLATTRTTQNMEENFNLVKCVIPLEVLSVIDRKIITDFMKLDTDGKQQLVEPDGSALKGKGGYLNGT